MKALIVDIGSNSIRFMQAERVNGAFRFFDKTVDTTRLAEGLLETHMLSKNRIAQSLDVLRTLIAQAESAGLPVFAYATSAVRDAENADELTAPLNRMLATPVRILTGEEEAAFAYEGAAGGSGGLIDVGGGSAQIVTGTFCKSYPLGCVRGRDACHERNDFSRIRCELLPLMQETFSGLPPRCERWTVVGGTATTIAALLLGLTEYRRDAVQGFAFTPAQADALLDKLGALSQKRAQIPLLTQRHDVILYGGAILLYLADALAIQSFSASDRDGMEGFARAVMR